MAAPRFVSSKEGLTGNVLKHFVAFSLDYPDSFRLVPRHEQHSPQNYAEFKRPGGSEHLEWEVLTIGHCHCDPRSDLPDFYSRFVEESSQAFSRQMPNYRAVSEGPTRIGDYEGHEFRFVAVAPISLFAKKFGEPLPKELLGRDSVEIWGRCVAVLHPTETKGVTLFMMVPDICPEVMSVDEVGVKGELQHILRSFRFR